MGSAALLVSACDRYDTGTPDARSAAVEALRHPDEPPNALRRAADAAFREDWDAALALFLEAAESPRTDERTITTLTRERLSELSIGHWQDATTIATLRIQALGLLLDEARRRAERATVAGDVALANRLRAAIRAVAAANVANPLIDESLRRKWEALAAE